MSFKIEHWMITLFTLAMMIGTYLIIKDLTGLATPFAIFILFVDEMVLFLLGIIGWRVDQVIDRIKG